MIELKEISMEYYYDKRKVLEITEMELMQINAARKAIIEQGSSYSESLEKGEYIHDKNSFWQVYDVKKTDLGITRVILWNEVDDGSYSAHFQLDKIEPDFICYEN